MITSPQGHTLTATPEPAGGAAPPSRQRRLPRLPRLDVLRPWWVRLASAGLAAGLLIVALHSAAVVWPVWVALVAPDLPGLAGAGSGLAPRQMHPRAVRAYNATHRLTGGLALTGTSLLTGSPTLTGISLAWIAHVLIDRAAGYTLRTPDGFLHR